MPRFAYQALDAKGQRVEGVDSAADQQSLVENLISQGLQPLEIKRVRSFQTLWTYSPKKLGHDDLLSLTKQLADLLEAGIPIERALIVAADAAEKKEVRDILLSIREEIQGGKNMSEALSSYPSSFNRLYINMVRVGELGGVLPAVLRRLETFLERSQHIRKFILTSSIYPSILAFVGLVSVIILVTFVVPKFGQIFEDLNQPMPLITKIIVEASTFIQAWWWMGTLVLISTAGAFYSYIKTPEGRKKWDKFILKMPIAGPMILNIEHSRMSRTLGTLIESGVPILKGISLAGEVLSNSQIKAATNEIYRGVRQGMSMSQLMKKSPLFPPLMVHMVAIGEETGKMGEMLLKIADDLDDKIQYETKVYLSLIEPITIVLMGLVIGTIILSMLLAIFGINDVAM